MSTEPKQNLAFALRSFADLVNSNAQLSDLMKGWEPVIEVCASDTGVQFYMPVRDSKIASIDVEASGIERVVRLRSTEAILTDVFAGRRNPAEAFLQQELSIDASERDQVKLDAISLVLRGT